jgi:hypothetical protein
MTGAARRGKGGRCKGVLQLATMSSDLRRRQRTRGWAVYGVSLVTIAVIILVVLAVSHDADHVVTQINQGLTH